MRALLKLTLLPILITIGIVLATLVGRAQPLPESIRALKLDQCRLPCWIGIVPGQTSVYDARQRLHEVFGDTTRYTFRLDNFNNWEIIDHRSGSLIYVSIYPIDKRLAALEDQSVVAEIALSISKAPLSESPSLPLISGEIVAFLGTPDALAFPMNSGDTLPAFHYPSIQTFVYAEAAPHLRLDAHSGKCSPVRVMRVISSIIVNQPNSSNIDAFKSFSNPWRGFGPCYITTTPIYEYGPD